jgi:drug/metabolite transporter (DMT)-like permease
MMSTMKPHQSTAAIAMIVLAAMMFSIMDAGTKYLGGFLSVVLVLWSRYAIQAGIMAVWIGRTTGLRGFRTAHPRFQLLRGTMLITLSALTFYSLRHMPLAEFTAIMMLWPVLLTAVSGWFLDEPMSRLRWALVWGGFIGTLIVIRPGSGLFGTAVVLPLIAMVVSTNYNLLTGRLARLENPHTTQFYTGVTGALLLTPLLVTQADTLLGMLRELTSAHVSLLAIIGLLGTFGHLLLVMAFSRAPAAALMPFTYAQIIFAAGMSWLAFEHTPDLWAWIGMAMIAACSSVSAWMHVRRPESARKAL